MSYNKITETFVRALALFTRGLCSVNTVVGNVFSWLSLAIVVVCFTVVIERYVFSASFMWMQDLYVWLNGAMFTAVAGFALLRDDHVRVDIFYRPASMRRKAAVDLVGVVLFLLPFTVVVFTHALDFVGRSWRLAEASANIGGMPGLFILKSFIPGFAVLLALQGVAMALRSILVLTDNGKCLPPHLAYKTPQTAERKQDT
ncbi:MAG: TRAP transporter small permease subunit [Hyphomicrobiales bacterium]